MFLYLTKLHKKQVNSNNPHDGGNGRDDASDDGGNDGGNDGK